MMKAPSAGSRDTDPEAPWGRRALDLARRVGNAVGRLRDRQGLYDFFAQVSRHDRFSVSAWCHSTINSPNCRRRFARCRVVSTKIPDIIKFITWTQTICSRANNLTYWPMRENLLAKIDPRNRRVRRVSAVPLRPA